MHRTLNALADWAARSMPPALLVVIAFLAMGILSARPLFLGGMIPSSSVDLVSYFYQVGIILQRAYAQGEAPFWNPYLFGGVPFLADPSAATFYPLSYVLYRAFSPEEGVRWMLLVHLAVAYGGTYAFLR